MRVGKAQEASELVVFEAKPSVEPMTVDEAGLPHVRRATRERKTSRRRNAGPTFRNGNPTSGAGGRSQPTHLTARAAQQLRCRAFTATLL